MKQPIISQNEALQILENELRKQALEKHAAELNNAGPAERTRILARIESELKKEMKRRKASAWKSLWIN